MKKQLQYDSQVNERIELSNWYISKFSKLNTKIRFCYRFEAFKRSKSWGEAAGLELIRTFAG